ncbi:MAG: 2-succinyl-5-enolpyruvyl-6-hydroxy-3-cyclohexene-1-carboxylic-acid synthase [Muribaculaceae bacterium]|nr:2-succinyl-5-enolpyruvyl-6-hydroxy-3-cyclohexene-1-carboxylic-acid synthase [Muribaculaceae bacterium]
MMKDTDKIYCRILLDVFEAHGIQDVVASPGSRNAPILISISYRENLRCHVITDERNAAFTALGIAMVSRNPVVLICTSGTALYNYAPAIAEAYYQRIPLIVISADRPAQWIGQNDSQTLLQVNALQGIVKKEFDIPVENIDEEMNWYVNRIANEAVNVSGAGYPGPVHINIQFGNPLSNTIDRKVFPTRVVSVMDSSPILSFRMIQELKKRLEGKRILIVAGFMPPDNSLNKYLSLFASLPNVKLLCETISNLHISGNPYAIDSVIAGLQDSEKEKLRPDIVISIGGALISGMLKDFIRKASPEIWTLGDTSFEVDCFKNLTLNIRISPAIFFKTMYHPLKKCDTSTAPGYRVLWDEVCGKQIAIRKKFVEDINWSELKAFRFILDNLPIQYNLFLSNGTSIRYAQLFTNCIPHASYANRGVSGIEGTNATAAGCALAYKGPTLLITGDMSFAYSPGIMGYALPPSFKIIVINNKGGGIFRFISPTRYIEHRDRFFCADPALPIEGLTQAYGWKYYSVDSEESMKRQFKDFLDYPSNTIMEIKIDEEYSASILRKYMRLNGLAGNKTDSNI